MDNYDLTGTLRPLMAFAKEFSTWYLRLSRERLRINKESQQVLGYALKKYTLLMAPFAPFMSERIYQNLSHDLDSIHLELWPEAKESSIDEALETQMELVQKLVEKGHAERKNAGIRLRQPLASIAVKGAALNQELADLVKAELNVKTITSEKGNELVITIDTKLTPELEAEGQARDLMRDIQGARKKLGLSPKDAVKVELPSWPGAWEEEIKKKVNATKLAKGKSLNVTPL
jgi:isoleucyl-tRNA synthetase